MTNPNRLLRVRPDVEVVGIEIDPERVRAAQGLTRPGRSFTGQRRWRLGELTVAWEAVATRPTQRA